MSKKRTAAESSNDEQTTEGSDPVFQQQQQGNAKRAKLVSLSDTTLEDLPTELLECIIVKAVAMEVKDMKLAKSVWKEKSELVINRLRTVCSKWSSICATIFFRNEVQRALDGTAHDAIRLEILHQYPIQPTVCNIASMKDEIFMFYRPNGQEYSMNVFDRSNIAEVKDVIPLPGVYPWTIVGCNVSNCLYVHHAKFRNSKADSISRIKRVEEHQFTLSPWLAIDPNVSLLSVSANGNIITRSWAQRPNPTVVRIYAPNSFLQREVVLSTDIFGFRGIANVIQKSNGNLVVAWYDNDIKPQLTEIDEFGRVLRQFKPALSREFDIMFADIYDRIFIYNWRSRFELIDSELNLLDFTGVQPYENGYPNPPDVHFNRERNEIMYFHHLRNPDRDILDIFRFT